MKTVKKIFWPLFFCLSAVIVASIHMAMQGHTLLDLYPPNGTWNDEVFYYKQVEAILRYGMPQGWYVGFGGYARYLTFYLWSPLIYLPYVVLAIMMGGVWNLYSPYLCNAIIFTVALLLLYFWARPNKWQIIRFIVLLFLSPQEVRYIFSGMSEALFFAFCIIMYAVCCKMERDDYDRGFLVFVYGLISFVVMIRPYYLPFFLIPFWFWRKRDLKKSLAVTGLAFVGSVAGHLLISHYFSAGQLVEGGLVATAQGTTSVFDIFVTFLSRFLNGWKDILRNTISYFVGGDYSTSIFLFTLIFGFILLWGIIEFIMTKRIRFSVVFSFVIYLAIPSAFCLMGSVSIFVRHVLPLTMWMICVVAMEMPPKILAVACAALLYFYVKFYPNAYYPYGNATDRAYDAQLAETLASKMELEEGVSWNNTVVWIIGGYRALYFLPPGFGIDMEWEYTESETLPPRKYVLSPRTPELDEQLAGTDKIVWNDDLTVLYER